MKQNLAETRKALEAESAEKWEDMKKRMQRDLDAANLRAEEAEAARDKAERSKKKAIQEVSTVPVCVE